MLLLSIALLTSDKIWMNECGGKVENLTHWGVGEEFPSLGIGHFIWYPEGQEGPFQESFPAMIKYLQKRGAKVPGWLTGAAPWQNKEEFLTDSRLKELRAFLLETKDLQADFMVQRLEKADLPRPKVQALLKQPGGDYALLDYLNFKGEGTSPKERYNGQGWGLLQVLEEMEGDTLDDFVTAAKYVLKRRVENAPKERNEERWLAGWYNRLETYH